MGMERVIEAIESNDWESLDEPAVSDFGDIEDPTQGSAKEDGELDPERLDFGYDPKDFEGMKKAIWGLDEDAPGSSHPIGEPHADGTDMNEDDVVKVEKMMRKLQAVKEAGEGLSEEQRKRMAARAVHEVMKEL